MYGNAPDRAACTGSMTRALSSRAVTASAATTGCWSFFRDRPLPDAVTRASFATLLCARRNEAALDAAVGAVFLFARLRLRRVTPGAAAAASFLAPRQGLTDDFETPLEASR